jgi:hypothetical protein
MFHGIDPLQDTIYQPTLDLNDFFELDDTQGYFDVGDGQKVY